MKQSRVELGELWEFPMGTLGLLGWVVVGQRPSAEDREFLVVPADSEDFVGPGDLAVPILRTGRDGLPRERAVLRGGFGCWVKDSDFWFQADRAQIAGAWRDAFAGLGQDGGSGDVELPNGFAEWVAEVLEPAVDDLGAWSARQRPDVRLRDRVVDEGDDLGAGLSLAAASSDLLGSLVAEEPGASEWSDPYCERELHGLKGFPRVFLQQYATCASLELCGAREGESGPPVVFVPLESGARMFLEFSPRLGGGWRSALFALDGPKLRLVVDGRPMVEIDLELPAL